MGLPAQAVSPKNVEFYNEEECARVEDRTRTFLQFLYKLEGNLRDLNPNKVKRIRFLESEFRKPGRKNQERGSAAFRELYNDPDWYHYQIQYKSRELIASLEELGKKGAWAEFKKYADEQVLGKAPVHRSATAAMASINRLAHTAKDFFVNLREWEARLGELGEWSRLDRSLDPNFEERTLLGFVLRDYLDCQIDYLDFAISRVALSR
jgi:hypothetical protein